MIQVDETIKEFRSVSGRVLKLLKNEERCRNDDKYLTYKVFQEIANEHGKNIFIPFELFSVFPAWETIKRTRAKIQNAEGLYPPTDPKVLEKRKTREKAVREWSRWQ